MRCGPKKSGGPVEASDLLLPARRPRSCTQTRRTPTPYRRYPCAASVKRGAQASSAWALKPQLLCSAHALLGTPPSTWVPLLPTHRPLHTNEPRPGLPDSKLVPCLLVWPVRRRLIRRRARDAIVVLLRVAIVSTSRTRRTAAFRRIPRAAVRCRRPVVRLWRRGDAPGSVGRKAVDGTARRRGAGP